MAIGQPTFMKAYPSAKAAGYSEKYARGWSYKLLDNRVIQQHIEAIRARRRKKSVCGPEETLELVSAVARGNPHDLLIDGDLNDQPATIPAEVMQRLVGGIKQKTRVIYGGKDDEPTVEKTIEYKLLDRVKAQQILMQHHGLLVDESKNKTQVDIKVLVGYPVQPMPLSEWEAQVREMMAQEREVQPALPGPA
jgi:phage terminase small subunit